MFPELALFGDLLGCAVSLQTDTRYDLRLRW
jgi:hypothetical protein